ncbi:MAG: PfkB family carbohydrate kinase [Kiritimatiellia bacterium]
MKRTELEQLLIDITRARVAVVGDFCLDAYWVIDPSRAEISVETGLPTRPVRAQRCSLGGAGNVVMNLLSLGVGRVHVFGVVGPDPFGQELCRLLAAPRVSSAGLLTQSENWITHVYVKPYVGESEQERLDFGNFNALAPSTASDLLGRLEACLPEVDAVVVNEQVLSGLHTEAFFQDALQALIRRHPESLFLLDSRHYSDRYEGTWRKINDHEAVRLCGIQRAESELVCEDEARQAGQMLYARWGLPIFLTRGRRGCLVADERGLHEIPGLQILSRTDPVGAGDSMLAGIAAALATRRDTVTAATFGNFVAGVTVQKLFQTGTATPEEILAIGSAPDYVYRPELAEDPRRARYLEDAEIELVTKLPGVHFTCAIFDHDGTISTLRQGWEQIMESTMVRAILGERFEQADEALYQKVVTRVRDYINRTTVVQTITQMKGLVELIREFGCVPSSAVLEPADYKELYHREMFKFVRDRLRKLERGELGSEDFTIKNALRFLQELDRRGVRLFLASGTDVEEVIREARALGYIKFFADRIYGSVDAEEQDAKKLILEQILTEIGTDKASTLVTFGDGPIEIRETRKRGGYSVGVASDEVRRFGLNPAKRARLIQAGADLIVPDYSQLDRLLAALNLA